MKTNTAGLKLIKDSEGFIDHWYPDPAHGWKIPTCCIGHTDTAGAPYYKDTKNKKFTLDEGLMILGNDLQPVENSVRRNVQVDLNDNQFAALVSFVFNLGEGNFKKSSLLKKLNSGDYQGAANEFPKWVMANGKRLKGLEVRRAKERALFLTAVEETLKPAERIDVSDSQCIECAPESHEEDKTEGWVSTIFRILNSVL